MYLYAERSSFKTCTISMMELFETIINDWVMTNYYHKDFYLFRWHRVFSLDIEA